MQRFPRWLSWIIFIFLGYVLITGNMHQGMQTREHPATATDEKSYPELQALMNGDRWKRAINPHYQNPDEACRADTPADDALGNYAIIREEGVGTEASCGETILVSVTLWNNTGKPSKTIADLSLKLGEQKQLDALLVGMKPGEERLLLLNPPTAIKALPSLKPGTQQTLTVTRIDKGEEKPATN
jgi:hypothetical protein